MSCSCNDKHVDFCHKPKVCDWKIDMVRNMIKCLCKCGDNPVDEPGCIATFITGEIFDGFPEYITYSKNGGPFKEVSFYDMEANGIPSIVNMLKNESLTGFAFTLTGDSLGETGELIEFCGLNSDGSFASSVHPEGYKPTELFMPNGVYSGPFNVKPEKTTLTFKASKVSSYMDVFHYFINPTGAETLTIESCAILEVLSDPLPPLA